MNSSGLKGEDTFPGTEQTVAEVLLTPTCIYSEAVRNVMRDNTIKGMVHITGGGFYLNIPRVLPQGALAQVDFNAWPKQPVFNWLKEEGNLSWAEMLQIFNCGIGYIMIVSPESEGDVLNFMQGIGQEAWTIGRVRRQEKTDLEQVEIVF